MVKLTSREYDVLTRLNKESKDIANELGVSLSRVKNIYLSLAGKLDVDTRTAVVIKALKLGLIDLDAFIL